MATGSPAKGVRQTVGCSTSVVLVEPADSGGLSDARQRPVFIELWDIGGCPILGADPHRCMNVDCVFIMQARTRILIRRFRTMHECAAW